MTIEECYSLMGADYRGVLRRLEKEDRVIRFLSRFPNEGSYALLCQSLNSQNAQEAFRAAHSIKGISATLGLTPLYHAASALADELRDGVITPEAQNLAGQVAEDYRSVVETIQAYLQKTAEE